MAATGSSSFRRKLDRFWATLFLTPEGRPKSALLLYSFCLSLLFFLVYVAAYWLLIDVIESSGAVFPTFVRNLLETLLPGMLGSVPCCALFFAFKDKKLVPSAYVWLALMMLAAMVAMAFLCDWTEYKLFLYILILPSVVSIVTGGLVSNLLYRRHLARTAMEAEA